MAEPRHGSLRNRLDQAVSPYLQLHATNPVDWYPWGPEAFAAAAERDVPVFLSIGYATCYWCHVMERESFADAATAARLNQAFVCVKVDREERPDLDELYMTAVQLLTGSGGWPMTVLLTPDRRPFFGGTYLPRRQLLALTESVVQLWREERERVLRSAQEITAALGQALAGATPAALDEPAIEAAVAHLLAHQDAEHGGHPGAPKFPQDMVDRLFLLTWHTSGDERALIAARRSLDAMALGGICDQLGGGFHRYSTDATWTVPHFEKMLYNQAGLLRAYAEAAVATGSSLYREVAGDLVTAVLRDLTDPATGGFYTALDAETEGEEGRCYLWDPLEVRRILGTDTDLFEQHYQVTDTGVIRRLTATAAPALRPLRDRLLAARGRRTQPLCDDKVLAGHNGLMIGALAQAGRLLGQPAWVAAAARCAHWLLATMGRPDGGLGRVWRGGRLAQDGLLDDYAALAVGLLDLHQATGEAQWHASASALARAMGERFGVVDGGFHGTSAGSDDLLLRAKPGQDNAQPSGNALAAEALLRLADLGQVEFRRTALDTVAAFGAQARRYPHGSAHLLGTARRYLMGDGGLHLDAVETAPGDYDARIGLLPGWHIGIDVAGDQPVATSLLTVDQPASVTYPAGQVEGPDGPLVWRDGAVIRVRLAGTVTGEPPTFTLRAQPCRQGACAALVSVTARSAPKAT